MRRGNLRKHFRCEPDVMAVVTALPSRRTPEIWLPSAADSTCAFSSRQSLRMTAGEGGNRRHLEPRTIFQPSPTVRESPNEPGKEGDVTMQPNGRALARRSLTQ
jgi:hypothetical protein